MQLRIKQKTYYELLEINKDATSDDIRKSYKKLALQNHPGRNTNDENINTLFRIICEAYEILFNAEKRAVYDEILIAKTLGLDGLGEFRKTEAILKNPNLEMAKEKNQVTIDKMINIAESNFVLFKLQITLTPQAEKVNTDSYNCSIV